VAQITPTHIAFPMIGYYGFAFLYDSLPAISLYLGIFAALCVAVFLFIEFRQWLSGEEEGVDIGWLAVAAVSWDALWSGPAKSAQAIGWNFWEIIASFLLVGCTVAIVGYLALLGAVMLNRRWRGGNLDIARLARREVVACWIEFSVIGYFGILALTRYVIGSDYHWPVVLLVTALVSLIPFALMWPKLVAARKLGLSD
jgi:hypothetical protein